MADSTDILITGASGFIGKQLCKHLQRSGLDVRAYVRASTVLPDSNGLEIVHGAINDSKALTAAMEGVSSVIHLAGIAHVDGIRHETMEQVNVGGTEAVLAAARQAGVAQIVYVSSALAQAAERRESTATDYGRSKWQAEQRVRECRELAHCILRPVNVYGPGMRGNLGKFISLIGQHRMPPLPPSTARMSLVSVNDVCLAIERALHEEQYQGKTWLLSDGIEYAMSAMEEAIYVVWGRSKPSWYVPRVLLYCAALAGELGNQIVPGYSGPGLRSYRNLFRDSLFDSENNLSKIDLQSTTSFFQELPAIVDHIKSHQQ